jgi:WD40 repeat protein
MLLTLHEGGQLRLWNVNNGDNYEIYSCKERTVVCHLTVLSDGRIIFNDFFQSRFCILVQSISATDSKRLKYCVSARIPAYTACITDVAELPNGYFVFSDDLGTIRVWNIGVDNIASSKNDVDVLEVSDLEESDLLVAEYHHRPLGDFTDRILSKRSGLNLAILGDGVTLLSIDEFGKMKMWDTNENCTNLALVKEFETGIVGLSTVTVLPDGMSIAVGKSVAGFTADDSRASRNCRVQLWCC